MTETAGHGRKIKQEKLLVPRLIPRPQTQCEQGHWHWFNNPVPGAYAVMGVVGISRVKLNSHDPWTVKFCILCGAALE
jgi:hypothetical protein